MAPHIQMAWVQYVMGHPNLFFNPRRVTCARKVLSHTKPEADVNPRAPDLNPAAKATE